MAWTPAGPAVLNHPVRSAAPPETKRQRRALRFRFPPALDPGRPPARLRGWTNPKNPGRGAVLPRAGRVGRRSLAGTQARWPREPGAEAAVPARVPTWPQPLQLRFAAGLHARGGRPEDRGACFPGA